MGVVAVITQQQRWLNVCAFECVPPNDRICLERSPPYDNSDAGHHTRERNTLAVAPQRRPMRWVHSGRHVWLLSERCGQRNAFCRLRARVRAYVLLSMLARDSDHHSVRENSLLLLVKEPSSVGLSSESSVGDIRVRVTVLTLVAKVPRGTRVNHPTKPTIVLLLLLHHDSCARRVRVGVCVGVPAGGGGRCESLLARDAQPWQQSTCYTMLPSEPITAPNVYAFMQSPRRFGQREGRVPTVCGALRDTYLWDNFTWCVAPPPHAPLGG
jgi:hypothetical protein